MYPGQNVTNGVQTENFLSLRSIAYSQLNRLQQIHNHLAVFKASKFTHTTPTLKSLHWLKINQHIEYKILSLTYKCLTRPYCSTWLPPKFDLCDSPHFETRSSFSVTLSRPSSSFSLNNHWPLITGRICRRQLCRYFVYSRADFGVFRPTGATRCTDQGEIWQEGADRRSAPPCQISPWSVQGWGITAPKTEKMEFYQYNCP